MQKSWRALLAFALGLMMSVGAIASNCVGQAAMLLDHPEAGHYFWHYSQMLMAVIGLDTQTIAMLTDASICSQLASSSVPWIYGPAFIVGSFVLVTQLLWVTILKMDKVAQRYLRDPQLTSA